MMKLMKPALLTAFATVAMLNMTGIAQAADLPKWVCKPGGPAAIDSDTVREITNMPLMMKVLQEYRSRWDAAYIRQQCDAAASGQAANISCLQGRRDWNAIQAMIPQEIQNADRSTVGAHLASLQKENDGLREAFAHCRELGVIK